MKEPVCVGNKYGTWKVIAKSTEDKPYNYDYVCQCECGLIKTFTKYILQNHKYSLCGCIKPKSKNKQDAIKRFKRDIESGNIVIENEKKTGNIMRYVASCKDGHKFIVNGEENYKGCAKCNSLKARRMRDIRQALNGDNFENTFPYQAEFWDYEKNELKPNEVLPSSKVKYWFKCEEGHEFDLSPAMIKHRGSWCPKCCHSTESRLATYGKELFRKMFYEVYSEEEFPIRTEIDGNETILYPDLIIEDLKLNIEFHGSQHYEYTVGWHENKNDFIYACKRDKAKKKALEELGYKQVVFKVTDDLEGDIGAIEDFLNNILL